MKKAGPRARFQTDSNRSPRLTIVHLTPTSRPQARGEVVLPLGCTAGGHGLPGAGFMPGLFGDVPLLLPWVLPVPGFDGLELDDPALGVAGLVEFDGPPALPGQGRAGDTR